jgi:hypothetical protein
MCRDFIYSENEFQILNTFKISLGILDFNK